LKAPDNLPKVVVARKGALRLAAGHPWVYKSDVSNVEDGAAPGALVAVCDDRGRFLGLALYSSSSQIAVRLISTEPVSDLRELVRERIRDAVAYRKNLVSGTKLIASSSAKPTNCPG
jgi:Predicted SAM-dependent methyltransferases